MNDHPTADIRTVDLESLTPRALALLSLASTYRATLRGRDERPALYFWTARELRNGKCEVLGSVMAHESRGAPAERPKDATGWVRVWAGDVWNWLARHKEIAQSVEAEGVRMLTVPRSANPGAHRLRVTRVASELDAMAWSEPMPAEPV